MAQGMDAPVLEVSGLRFHYPGVPVLAGADFALRKGDYAGLVGANGSGKSTLLKLLLGVLPLQQGEIRWFGQPIGAYRQWPRVGYLPQNSSATRAGFPANGLEVVLTGLHSQMGRLPIARKRHKEQALSALRSLGVEDLAKRRIGDLSGGQLQRVMLARTLAVEPDVLLLDEPTTGVDAGAADALYALLKEWNEQRGLTILMVSHDVARLGQQAGRLFFMEEGQVVECDDDFHRHPPAHLHTHRPKGGARN